jgi:tetratricopeptide (TPR) repeat protein
VADYFMEKDEVNTAIRYYEKGLDQNPSDYELYAKIAIVYARENRKLDRALELTDRSLILKADNAPALKAKGYIYYLMGDTDSARIFLRAALDKNPDDIEVKTLLTELESSPEGARESDTITDEDTITDTNTDVQ